MSLDILRSMLNNVGINDDVISRGVRLTKNGMEKVAKKFNCSIDEVLHMLQALKTDVAQDISEDFDRFTFEPDLMGNLTIRDAETGDEKFLQGQEAFDLEQALNINPDKQQQLIAAHFGNQLNETDGYSKEQSFSELESGTSGTFNFPYKGKFATARFWEEDDGSFNLEIISLLDSEQNEIEITPELEKELKPIAMKWVDKV